MAILARVRGFTGEFESKNFPERKLAVSVADVMRAAATVGGPVKGTAWQRSQRRVAIVGTVLGSLTGSTRRRPLRASVLYSHLESTEKGGVSFRLGMAFAAIMADRVLAIDVLEHLNSSNSLLQPTGSRRRADLFGFDREGRCHVVEAKARAHGYDEDLVELAKEQAANVMVVDVKSGRYVPRTRSAAITDLSSTPISVLLSDPPEGGEESRYEIDIDEVLAAHYSVVPDLLALRGGAQEPPRQIEGDIVGAYLPGADVWLGVERSLYGESKVPWRERVRGRAAGPAIREGDERTSVGRDGHVLQLGQDLSDVYESWQERDEVGEERDEGGAE